MGFFSSIKKALQKVPVVGRPLAAVYGVAVLPGQLVEDVAHGARIDHVLVNNFKDQAANVKSIAPYATTIVGFVPGVGQGVGAMIAAGTALASGHPLSEALVSGIKGAIPGGALAQGVFAATAGLATGKGIDSAALAMLPLPPEQKAALTAALGAAKKLASGQKVSDIVMTEALKQLPPDVAKAVQVGVAVGHATKIQTTGAVAAQKVSSVLAGVNSKHPETKRAALQAVAVTHARAEKGDKQAAAMLTLLGKHAAAKRVTNRFRVHAKTGIVFRVKAAS